MEPLSFAFLLSAAVLALVTIFGRVSITLGGLPGHLQGRLRADLPDGTRLDAALDRHADAPISRQGSVGRWDRSPAARRPCARRLAEPRRDQGASSRR